MLREPKNMSSVYIAVAIILIGAFFAWRHRQPPPTPTLIDDDIAEEMKLRAGQAVVTAADDFDITLDYSPKSVEQVETILAKLHDQHHQTPIEDAQLTKAALKWGGYIGEVIKTQRECDWAIDSSAGGPGSLPIVYDDKSESFPVQWCYKRIVNGAEDNVWHKFTILVLDRDNSDALTFTPDNSNTEGQPDAE